MNLDQVYDELYGAIDENLRSDTSLAGRVGTLETKMTAAEGDITALEGLIPEVPGRQLKLVNLGTEYTEELQEDISTGAFEKAVVGGYLTINEHVYIFAHPDYFFNAGYGSTRVNTHHMVVVPANMLATGRMNLTNTATGGYLGSDLRNGHEDTTDPDNPVHVNGALEDAAAIIINDFGADNILTVKQQFTNAISDGAASSWSAVNSTIELMNETMLYGHTVASANPYYDTAIAKTQFKLFSERPDLISIGLYYWLRDIASATTFATMNNYGAANRNDASNIYGVRPYFCIK